MTNWTPSIEGRGGPRYLAIADALADDITRRHLKDGDRLPTHRDLAYRLGVTVGTVTRAYGEAMRRGLMSGEVGRGSFVRATRDSIPTFPPVPARRDDFIDLGRAVPVLELGAGEIAATLARIAGSDEWRGLLGYVPPRGLETHREAGAEWIGHVGGLSVDPARIMVTAGAQHAMMMALGVLTRPGDVVLCENLTFNGFKAAATMLGLRVVGVEIDGDGLVPDALEAACRAHPPKALYAIPSLQNPTNSIMPAARRERIAAICARHGVTVIEDDIYAHLLDRKLPAIASFPGVASIYVTSMSKCLAPGVRVGFAAASADLVERMETPMRASIMMAPPILAEAASQLIRSGEAARIARELRGEMRRRQAIARTLLGAPAEDAPSSLHVWLDLPEPWRREEFTAAAQKRGVGVAPADSFAVGRASAPHAVRVSLGATRDHATLKRALSILAEILRRGPQGGATFV